MQTTLVCLYLQVRVTNKTLNLFFDQSQLSQLRARNFKLICEITYLCFFIFLKLLKFVTLSCHVFYQDRIFAQFFIEFLTLSDIVEYAPFSVHRLTRQRFLLLYQGYFFGL